MKRELEERCNEVTKDLLGSLKNLKKEKKENENRKISTDSNTCTVTLHNSNNG